MLGAAPTRFRTRPGITGRAGPLHYGPDRFLSRGAAASPGSERQRGRDIDLVLMHCMLVLILVLLGPKSTRCSTLPLTLPLAVILCPPSPSTRLE